jgi:hypothetical protein
VWTARIVACQAFDLRGLLMVVVVHSRAMVLWLARENGRSILHKDSGLAVEMTGTGY